MSTPSESTVAITEADELNLRRYKLKYPVEAHNVTLVCSVSPCSWMHDGYPFQIECNVFVNGEEIEQIHGQDSPQAGRLHLSNQKLRFENATPEDVVALASQVHFCKCSQTACQRIAFDPKFHAESLGRQVGVYGTTNRNGMCEQSFCEKLEADFKKINDKQQAELLIEDAKQLAKGYVWKVSAWVHAGGDDQPIDFFQRTEPTEAEVVTFLKRRGSRVLNDYKIIDLRTTVPADLLEKAQGATKRLFLAEDERMYVLGYGFKLTATVPIGGKTGRLTEIEWYFFNSIPPTKERISKMLKDQDCPTPEQYTLTELKNVVPPATRALREKNKARLPILAPNGQIALSSASCKANGLKKQKPRR